MSVYKMTSTIITYYKRIYKCILHDIHSIYILFTASKVINTVGVPIHTNIIFRFKSINSKLPPFPDSQIAKSADDKELTEK